MRDPEPLQGKVAIVTGAGGGIGRAYSRGLAEAGAAVVLADIRLAGAQDAADALTADGLSAHAVEVDVTDGASVGSFFKKPVDVAVQELVHHAQLLLVPRLAC